jgi:8-oxo-dGTP pyrophosphatase MutT (NUDIX family)
MSRILVKTTVAAIIMNNRDGIESVLLTMRSVPPYKNFWCLPGGHIDPYETADDAIVREVEEETGVQIDRVNEKKGISTYHMYPHKGQMVLKETQWFEMYYPGKARPQVEAGEGITGWKWGIPGEADFILENTYASILDVLKGRNLI